MERQINPDLSQNALACVPHAIPAGERATHFALIQKLLDVAVSREDLPNGMSLTFEADRLEEIATFVANERKCCPFLNFDLSAPGFSNRLTLTLSGPAGTREFLNAEFAGHGKSGP